MTERLHFSLSCIGEGNGNPLQCSCLENPRDGGAWWAAVYGVAQSWTQLTQLSSSSRSSLSLLQGIFSTQGLNPSLPHCRQILYQPGHKDWPLWSEMLVLEFQTCTKSTGGCNDGWLLNGLSLPGPCRGSCGFAVGREMAALLSTARLQSDSRKTLLQQSPLGKTCHSLCDDIRFLLLFLVAKSCLTLLQLHELWPTRLLCP